MRVKNCAGFTLLEVLMVVLIAALVLMFAVPSYKKAQDRNRYMAASGVLVDIGNAAHMMWGQYPSFACSLTISANGADTSTGPVCSVGWMQSHGYLSKLPLTSGKYLGYQYRLSTQGTATGCGCGTSGDVIACMSSTQSTTSYTCAWVDRAGILHHN